MAEYSVVFARSARRELEQLEPGVARRADDLWRIRVGDYRVIYSIDDGARIVDISAVRHRSEAYR